MGEIGGIGYWYREGFLGGHVFWYLGLVVTVGSTIYYG